MTNAYSFRNCEPVDCQELAKLVNRIFGTEINSDYMKWKHFSSSSGKSLSSIARCNGHVVGLLGAVPVTFTVNGEDILGAQEVDVAIENRHRSLRICAGLFNQEGEALRNNKIDFTYGVTVQDTASLNRTLLGKKCVDAVPRLVKIIDCKPILEGRIQQKIIAKTMAALINGLLFVRYPQKPVVIPLNRIIRQIDQFDKRFDEFCEKIKKDYPIMVKRDSNYLTWRYINNPIADYDFFCLESKKNREIEGYIVIGTKPGKSDRGIIYDIVTPRSSSPNFARCLIGHALERFRLKAVAVIECWMFPHAHVYRELIRQGFTPREKAGYELNYQCINLKNSFLAGDFAENVENWYIARGDSDNL